MESLLQLGSYSQTAVCTHQTEFYELSVRQWCTLLQLKQNQGHVEMMLRRLQLRLTSRLTRPAAQQVSLYSILLKRVNQLIQEAEEEARQVRPAALQSQYAILTL